MSLGDVMQGRSLHSFSKPDDHPVRLGLDQFMTVQTPARAPRRTAPVLRTAAETPVPPVHGSCREIIEIESPLLWLRVSYPTPDVAVLTATGDVDIATAPRVAALLWPRLLTKLSTVVLDLSGVTFLGVAGLELITAARAYAPYRDVEFIVVGGSKAVERALHAGGLANERRNAINTVSAKSMESAAGLSRCVTS